MYCTMYLWRTKLIFHCRNQQEKEVGNEQLHMFNCSSKDVEYISRSYEKNGQYSTPQSTILLQN